MQGYDNANAAARAVWLATIAETLEEATRVVSKLGRSDMRIEIFQLYAEIEALKLEVESMRLRPARHSRTTFDPDRINLWPDEVVRRLDPLGS